MPDLHDEQPSRIQVAGRVSDDAPHEIETIAAARQRERRLAAIFGGKPAHHCSAYVGRIGHDEVVAAIVQLREQIRTHERHALLEVVIADIAACDLECIA